MALTARYVPAYQHTYEGLKIRRVASELGVSREHAFGCFIALMLQGAVLAKGDLLEHATPEDVDEFAGIEGFYAAAEKIGWVRATDDGIVLVDFEKHNDKAARKRDLGRDRQARWRDRQVQGSTETPRRSPREDDTQSEGKLFNTATDGPIAAPKDDTQAALPATNGGGSVTGRYDGVTTPLPDKIRVDKSRADETQTVGAVADATGPAGVWGSAKYGIQFDPDSREWVGITDKDMRQWAEAFPLLNVAAELRRAAVWMAAHPRRAKAKKDLKRFIVTAWLAREQESAGSKHARSGGTQTGGGPRKRRGEVPEPRRDWRGATSSKGADDAF